MNSNSFESPLSVSVSEVGLRLAHRRVWTAPSRGRHTATRSFFVVSTIPQANS